MLTREDLYAIEGIIVRIVEKVLDEKLKKELNPIRADIIMIKSEIKKIKVDMKKMERRLYRIENHLHLSPMVFDRSR